MTSSPSYITKNRLGIFYFQHAIPSRIHVNGKNQHKKLFRKSLHTRERREALKQARFLWLIMHKLFNKYFEDPASLARAMELLKKYDSFCNSDWLTVESEFFDSLDDNLDAPLLDSALKMRLESLAKDSENEALLNHYKRLAELYLSNQSVAAKVTYSEEENPKISVLIKKWLDIRQRSGIKKNSFESISQRINIFLHMISEIVEHEPSASEITPIIIRSYYDLLKRIPAHRNAKNLIGKTFAELSTLGLTPLSDKTYAEYTSVVAGFLKWAEMDGFPVNKELAGILDCWRAFKTTQVCALCDYPE